MTTAVAKRKSGNRLLGPGYAQALRVFVNGRASWLDIAAACGVTRGAAQALCHGMRRQKLIHVVDWYRKFSRGGGWTPIYAFGPGVNMPHPLPSFTVSQKSTPSELLAFCDLVKTMQGTAWHAKGLAVALDQCERTVRRTMKAMHALRLIHVEDFDHRKNGGYGYALYQWGPDQEDMKKPARQSKRAIWTRNNQVQAARRQQVMLMHAMVLGVSMDKRRAGAVADEVAA